MALPLRTDEIDIAVDPVTGDIPETGDLTMASGITAVMQGARIRLRMFAGEWFLNLAQGVPYLERSDGSVTAAQALFGQKFDRGKTLRAFRDQLLGDSSRGIVGVPGIVELLALDVAWNGATRTATVTWKARTAFGDTPLDVLVI